MHKTSNETESHRTIWEDFCYCAEWLLNFTGVYTNKCEIPERQLQNQQKHKNRETCGWILLNKEREAVPPVISAETGHVCLYSPSQLLCLFVCLFGQFTACLFTAMLMSGHFKSSPDPQPTMTRRWADGFINSRVWQQSRGRRRSKGLSGTDKENKKRGRNTERQMRGGNHRKLSPSLLSCPLQKGIISSCLLSVSNFSFLTNLSLFKSSDISADFLTANVSKHVFMFKWQRPLVTGGSMIVFWQETASLHPNYSV